MEIIIVLGIIIAVISNIMKAAKQGQERRAAMGPHPAAGGRQETPESQGRSYSSPPPFMPNKPKYRESTMSRQGTGYDAKPLGRKTASVRQEVTKPDVSRTRVGTQVKDAAEEQNPYDYQKVLISSIKLDRNAMRTGIIMREILGPPKSLSDEF